MTTSAVPTRPSDGKGGKGRAQCSTAAMPAHVTRSHGFALDEHLNVITVMSGKNRFTAQSRNVITVMVPKNRFTLPRASGTKQQRG